jgi:hypothetical protein
MRLFIRTLLGILVLGVLLILASFLLPSRKKISRSVRIEAPSEHVYRNIIDFHFWTHWSPWLSRAPELQPLIDGPMKGQDARFCWKSEDILLRDGCITITEAQPFKEIRTEVTRNQTVYQGHWQLKQQSSGTRVTWSILVYLDDIPIVGRYLGLFADSFLGHYLEDGLAQLRKQVEDHGDQFFSARPPAGTSVPHRGK